MKRKKYLACLLAMSMMLVSASPMAVSADAQDVQADVSFEDELDAEGLDVSVDEETNLEAEESEDEATVSDQTGDTNLFTSEAGEDTVDVGDEAESEEDGWIQSEEVTGLSFKYDSSNQTFYLKSSTPVALPDNTQSGWTSEWRNKYGTELNSAKTVVIEGEITQIGEYNFDNGRAGAYDSLEHVVLSPSVTKISRSAFGDVSTLKDINLNNVEEVGKAAFIRTGVESVAFEKDQLKIEANAFKRCTSLTTVTAKKIQDLGANAFDGCTALTSFNCESNIDKIPNECFQKTALISFDFKDVSSVGVNAFNESSLKYACYAGTKVKWDEMVPEPDWMGATVPADTIVHCKADTVEAKDATCTEDGWKEIGVCEVCGEHYSYPTDENKIPATGHTWSEDYVVDKEATCTEAGEKSKHCTVCGAKEDVQAIPASGHKFSDWRVTTGATVFNAEKQERTCASCGVKETRTNGTALKATVSVNASNVKLKVKQSTTGLKVTGLAKGDSVKTWRSTNTKIFTVKGNANGTCKLTAKKAGTAKLQITLASGLKKNVTIKVQKSAVKTTKVTVASKKVTIQKGKKTVLKPVVTPFTSRQKVTYTSSNKKVATVSKNGVVTGKKKGTAKITVRSGNKTVKVTVRVK